MSTNPFYVQQPVSFQCSGCGECCRGDPDTHYIELLPGEAKAIYKYLDIGRKAFERDYMVNLPAIGKGVRITEQGYCSLLSSDKRCSVYEVRPLQCSSYPYWPEVMHSRATWNAEATRCEGINQGNAVKPEEIDSQLARFQI